MRRFKILAKTVMICSLCIVVCGIVGYFAILNIFPFPYDSIKAIHYSKSIYDKDGNMLRSFTGEKDLWLMPVELSEINPDFVKATLAIEDKRFFKHPGIDVGAVIRAIKLNIANKRIISGASTVSMQVIRILEGRDRTMLNKVIEAVHAVHLESIFTKEEILKLYFEIAPYGGNIHGVKAASLRYFQKHPKDLSLSECALLAGLPQSPSYLRPDRYSARAETRRNRVLSSMLKNGYIANEQYENEIHDPVIADNHPFPFEAAHFARFVKNKFKEPQLVTTLDSNIQYFSQLALEEKINELKPYGVTNGAIVVIENKTGAVRALVGSVDFFSEEDSGQINGALSRRCPGSTLKPFTYALALEKGFYTPRMMLADVPVQYAGYAPLDYDREYRGLVTVEEALVDSLNIPAVEVLDKVGYRNLYFFLERIGISTLNKAPEHYGLSLTLGSCEVRLLEIVNAYAALARSGVYMPIKYLDDSDHSISRRVLSEASSYMVADILSDTERLKAIGIYRNDNIHPKLARKTGTSYDHKDAWTISYNPEYTVGVWLGNFSGKSSKVLVGIETAAPVAIRIFDWLYTNRTAPWYEMPNTIGERYVCALSGEPVSDDCEHRVKDLYIKRFRNAQICSLHEKTNDSKTYVVLDKNKPMIVSPSHRCEYFITGMPINDQKLVLTANGSPGVDNLYWFIDDKFYNRSYMGEKLFWDMAQGKHTITCADNYGRSSSVTIVVR